MKLTREAIQRMISQKQGTSNVTVINQEGGGGGGGVTLGPLLTSLNAEAMPSAEGYLHWTGSVWAFDTPTGGDPVDLTPYALKMWVQTNYASKDDIADFITESQAEDLFAALNHTHANYLPLSAGPNKALTGSLYFSGNSGINWAGGVGMLACTPESGWTGISSNQWGVGALSAQGVIRSNANDILHYRNGTNYKIWDAYNFTPSDYLPLTGGTVQSLTVTNGLDADSITVSSLVNSDTLAEYLDADAMQTWGDRRYLKLTDKAGLFTQLANYDGALQITIGGTQKSLTIAYANAAGSANTAVNADKLDNHHAADFALASSLGNYLPLTGGTLTGTLNINTGGLNISYNYHQPMTVYSSAVTSNVGWVGIQFGHIDGDNRTPYGGIRMDEQNGALKRYTSAYSVYTIWDSGNFNPSNYLPLSAGGSTPLTGSLYWNVANQTDNLIISNNKIQLSVSGTPHNIVLFEGTTASLTSYAKFYERPMVKTGTNVYTNVALVSEVEAKQDIIHFLNTNNNESEVDFSYLHLPLSNIGAGHASLDLSAYVTSSELTTALGAYLPLVGGRLTGTLNINTGALNVSYNYHQPMTVYSSAVTSNVGWVGVQFGHIDGDDRTSYGGIRMDEQNGALKRYTSAYTVYTIWDSGNFNPSNYLPLSAGSSTPLTGSLYWNVANQTDNLIISNNKIQLSVSGTPHNIVLFEGTTASLTSYAKFYERPMVKTGTNVYTNVALVSEVEAKQDIIHFLNTNNNDSEVYFSYLHLPLSNIGAGHASLDLSSYMPLAGDSIKTGKLAVGTTAFDGSNAKLQVGGNMFATGSITSKSNAGNVSLGNGNISATNLYISTVVFGSSNNDPAIYIGNGHVYARNSQGQTAMII